MIVIGNFPLPTFYFPSPSDPPRQQAPYHHLFSPPAILRGNKEDLILSTIKVMTAFVLKGEHRGRMYLLEGAMLPEIISAMMHPIGTQARVLALARLFSIVTAEMDFDLLDKLIRTTPDIMPFLGLAKSVHENRRDLVQKWIEFYGNSIINFHDIYEAFATYGTLNGFAYLALNCTTPDAPHFRRMILHIIVEYYKNIRKLGSYGLIDYAHEFLVQTVLEMCDRDGREMIEAGVRFMHDFLVEDDHGQTPILLEHIWNAKKLNYLIRFLFHKSMRQAEFAPTTQHKLSRKDWNHHEVGLERDQVI